jgi:hypothetical protein
MKKLSLILIVAVLMPGLAVCADGGKKVAKKKAHKKELARHKCPNRPGCICH